MQDPSSFEVADVVVVVGSLIQVLRQQEVACSEVEKSLHESLQPCIFFLMLLNLVLKLLDVILFSDEKMILRQYSCLTEVT